MADTSDVKQKYEDMFSDRFTAQDAEYQKYLKMPEGQPPIVEDWRGGNQRNQDRYRDNRQRGWEGRRDWSHNSYNQQRGGRGWGNNHNQYRQDRSHQTEGEYQSGHRRYYPDHY
ncbi:hypothetical protein GDO81_009595 [Engystomops pustulosus]|nr:hypothetical protein GDO81_009595 [Engystomops pustulosus]KAG8575553.1 hypothetical protein GDO81_009595 [Engystomops pustulosus]